MRRAGRSHQANRQNREIIARMIDPYWQENGIEVYHGNCLQIMPQIKAKSVHTIISDPPFAFAGGISSGFASRVDSQFFEHWLIDVFQNFCRISDDKYPWFLWCDWKTISIIDSALKKASIDYYNTRKISQIIHHDREMIGMGGPFRNQVDYIALIRGPATKFNNRIPKNQPNIIRSYWYYGKHDFHPAEKDIKIAKQLIMWACDPGDIILDPFMGAGTILLAAQELKRKVIGIDIEKAYCEITIKRLKEEKQTFLTL